MTSDEIKKAMREFLPVRYDGIEYRQINAFIWRIVRLHTNTYKEFLQLELQSYRGNYIIIAEAEKVELINDGHSENDGYSKNI